MRTSPGRSSSSKNSQKATAQHQHLLYRGKKSTNLAPVWLAEGRVKRMRVKSGFWSNRRLPKKVQSYCSRHIQADSCHLLPHPPCSHARVSCLWLLFCLLTLSIRGSPDPDWLHPVWRGRSRSKPMALRLGRALQPCPVHRDTPSMGTLSITPYMCTAKCGFRSIRGS